MVSVTIIGVACGGGYSGEGAAVVALGECGEDLLLPIIKWMCFACMIFEKLKTNQRQKCLNKCFCIKCKTKLHILCSICSTFLKFSDNGDILAQSLSIICMCILFFFLAVKFVYLMMTTMMRVVLHSDQLNASQMGTEIQMYELVHCIFN